MQFGALLQVLFWDAVWGAVGGASDGAGARLTAGCCLGRSSGGAVGGVVCNYCYLGSMLVYFEGPGTHPQKETGLGMEVNTTCFKQEYTAALQTGGKTSSHNLCHTPYLSKHLKSVLSLPSQEVGSGNRTSFLAPTDGPHRNPGCSIFLGYLHFTTRLLRIWAVLTSPAKSSSFSGLNGNYTNQTRHYVQIVGAQNTYAATKRLDLRSTQDK